MTGKTERELFFEWVAELPMDEAVRVGKAMRLCQDVFRAGIRVGWEAGQERFREVEAEKAVLDAKENSK